MNEMPIEEWRAVVDCPLYEVSNLGRARSWRKQNGVPTPHAMTLHPNSQAPHYLMLHMTVEPGKRRIRAVHRLMMAAFVGPRPEGMVIRHLDGNAHNNVLANLTYGTQAENVADTLTHGTHWCARKTECKQGHPLSGDNLYVLPNSGGRGCRTCRAAAGARRDARRRAEALS